MDGFRNVVFLEYQAQAAYAAQQYQEASVLHGRAVLQAQCLEPRLVAALCLRLGNALSAGKAGLDAAAAYEAGFQACCAVTPPDVERLLTSLQSVGPYLYRFERMDLPCHDDAATDEALQTAMVDPILPARLLIECAEEYERQASLYLALYTYKRALEYLHMPDELELRVDILARVGSIAHGQGELATVDAALSELVELWFSTTNAQSLCHILPALGGLYEVVGSVENARSVYREALKISLKLDDAVAIGHARGRLTRLSLQQQGAKRERRAAPQHKFPTANEYPRLPLPATNAPRQRAIAEPVYIDQTKR